MHGFAACDRQRVRSPQEPPGRMHTHTQVDILRLQRNFTAPVHEAEPWRHLHVLWAEAHDAGLVRRQVDLHIKQPAEHIKDVHDLLCHGSFKAKQPDIISVHHIWHVQPTKHWPSPWQLELDQVVQQLFCSDRTRCVPSSVSA